MKIFNISTGLLFTLIAVHGCTPYKAAGLMGGYSNMQLSEDVFQVSFRGNGYTSPESTQQNVFHRCAELTFQHGYKYFLIVNAGTVDRPSVWQSSGVVNLNTTGNTMGSFYGNNFYGNQNYSTYGFIRPPSMRRIDRFTSTVTMKMLKSNKGIPQAYNAEIILRNFN